MNDSQIKDLANQQIPINTALRGFINSTNYINLGIITKVHDENYVDVKLYYTNSSGKDSLIQAVRLLHVGTTKCKINIVPAVGDNVLLLCPKDFIETLEYNRKPQKSESCYLPYGNINMCGILIKDESDDNVKTEISINEKGDIDLKTDGDINIDNEKDVNIKTKGNVVLESDKDVDVTAKKVTAMCSTFTIKADKNSQPVFEVTT